MWRKEPSKEQGVERVILAGKVLPRSAAGKAEGKSL